MADLVKNIDSALRATTRQKRPSLFEIRGQFYHGKSGKPVKVAPVKPTLVRPSGVSRDMWTWVEKGGRAWGGEDPRGKERTPRLRYHDWVARGGQKRAARAAGGKRRHGGDSGVVDVLFRVLKSGEDKGIVEAWFPGLPGTNAYYRDMLTYAHMGQHGSGDIVSMQQRTRNATPTEYAALKRELESLGPEPYKLRVVKKMTRKHFEQRKAAVGY